MTLVKTSFLSGIAVLVKIACALVLNKVLALYVGPSGYAVIGQFQNVISILLSISGGLFSNGVVKLTAQHQGDHLSQQRIWKTAFLLSIGLSMCTGFFLVIFAQAASTILFSTPDMKVVFICLGFVLPAIAINNVLLAVVNGKKEVIIYITSNIVGSIAGLVVMSILVDRMGLFGALIAFIINPTLVLFTNVTLSARRKWFKLKYFVGNIDNTSFRELTGFAIMGVTAAFVVPATYIIIRNMIISNVGIVEAGYWQASWKISEIYLMLITTTLSLYYLPRLAELKTTDEIKSEIVKVYIVAMPVVIACASTLYILRDFVTVTLFSDDFYPMRELFAWQLIGDVIKIGSWILAYIMIAKAMVKIFVITEIIFSLTYLLLSWLFISIHGLQGAPMAYATNYLIYWLVVHLIMKNYFSKRGNLI